MQIYSLKIKNYKGIKESEELIFSDRISLICGKNNACKTTMLEFVYDLFNSNKSEMLKKRNFSMLDSPIDFEITFLFKYDSINYKAFIYEIIHNYVNQALKSPRQVSNQSTNHIYQNIDAITAQQLQTIILNNRQNIYLKFNFSSTGSTYGNNDFASQSITLYADNYELPILKLIYQEESSTPLQPRVFLLNAEKEGLGYTSNLEASFNFNNLLKKNENFILKAHRVCNPNEYVSLNTEYKIKPDFSNYKQTLFTIKLNQEEKFQIIQQEVREIFTEIDKIEFTTTGGNPLSGNVVIKPVNQDFKVSINDMGTGTEQIIGLITAVITAEQSSVFLIDEPHVFLHPEAERKLIKFLKKHPEHQYILTTHSPIMINSVDSSCINLIKNNDGILSITKIDTIENVNKFNLLFEELEFNPSDFWFHDSIIWVEGETEEKIIPLLIEKYIPELKSNYLVKKVFATSEFQNKKVDVTKKIYELINHVQTFFHIPNIFILDGEELTSQKITDLKDKIGVNKILIISKREIENYFLNHPDIIQLIINTQNIDEIQNKINEILARTNDTEIYGKYANNPSNNQLNENAKLAKCRGAKVLNELFTEFLNYEYSKTRFAEFFTDKILAKEELPETFKEIANFIKDSELI